MDLASDQGGGGLLRPSWSARRTSWARPAACIFRITWRRCILTVISLTPSSPAICLFKRPAITSASTCRSRAVRVVKRLRNSAIRISLTRRGDGRLVVDPPHWGLFRPRCRLRPGRIHNVKRYHKPPPLWPADHEGITRLRGYPQENHPPPRSTDRNFPG